jgi:CubicO group peptidase (beta-lactamase class C family)
MKMRRLLRTPLVVAAAFVLAAGILSGQQSVFTPGGTLPLLDAYLEPLRLQAGIPGMSAAVLSDGELVWEKGYGFQNLATRERPTADTPYLVGDMSGTLAAVLLLQCVEQRRVGLDDPFSRYGMTAPEPEATLRGILSHAPPAAAREPFIYSPERYETLTSLMEWCAPQSYRKSVAHRILNRLAMRDSVPGTDLLNPDFSLPTELFTEEDADRYRTTLNRMAVPYRVTGRTKTERSEIPQIPMSATGGLVSTARDLAKLDSWLDRRDLLLDETLAAAWRPAADRNGAPSPMGLGWFVQTYRNERVVWHFGFVPNAYSSLILKLPDRKLTFILLANSDGLSAPFQLQAGDVTRSIFAALFLRLTT